MISSIAKRKAAIMKRWTSNEASYADTLMDLCDLGIPWLAAVALIEST